MDLLRFVEFMVKLILAVLTGLYYAIESVVLRFLPTSLRRPKDVRGEVVLVTGGGCGLGRLMAIEFAKLGAVVVSCDIDDNGNEETAKLVRAFGGTVHTYRCDISRREEVYKVAEKIREEVAEVTILVNNAGIVNGKTLLETPDDKIQRIFDINILAHFWTIKAFLPGMIKEGRGHIVTIASLAGYFGTNRLVDYCSTKFAAVGLDESLNAELKAAGHDYIHTTCVCPFFTNTGMFAGVQSKIFSLLPQEYVVNEIVKGVLLNEEILIIPRVFIPLMILKVLLCRKSANQLGKVFEDYNMMTKFSGRSLPSSTDDSKARSVHEE